MFESNTMQIACLQENLLAALSTVNAAVASRSTLPVLSNVLLKTENGMLKIAATNLEIAITTWIGAKVTTEGGVTVPARTLTELISSFPPEKVEMSLDENGQTLFLTCGRANAKVKGIDENEYPIIPAIESLESDGSGYQKFTFGADTLSTTIAKTAFATAPDGSRPVLEGVQFSIKDSQVEAAAADGFRLSVVKQSGIDSNDDTELVVNIPSKSLAQVSKAAKNHDGNVEMYVTQTGTSSNKFVIFKFDNTEIKSQLIEGKFPDYKQIIPVTSVTQTIVDIDNMQRALKQAFIFAKDSSNIVKFDIVPANDTESGHVIITSNSSEMGNFETKIDANITGTPLLIAFNGKYMLDMLSAMSGFSQVSIQTTGNTNPCMFKAVGTNGTDDDFLHIIMPMHVNN